MGRMILEKVRDVAGKLVDVVSMAGTWQPGPAGTWIQFIDGNAVAVLNEKDVICVEAREAAPAAQKPSIGRVVHYRLSDEDAANINRRRISRGQLIDQITADRWPFGAQAHVGNAIPGGEIVPMIVVRVLPDEFGPGKPGVNGQVLLDGNDSLWVTSVPEGDLSGQWSWPPRS